MDAQIVHIFNRLPDSAEPVSDYTTNRLNAKFGRRLSVQIRKTRYIFLAKRVVATIYRHRHFVTLLGPPTITTMVLNTTLNTGKMTIFIGRRPNRLTRNGDFHVNKEYNGDSVGSVKVTKTFCLSNPFDRGRLLDVISYGVGEG